MSTTAIAPGDSVWLIERKPTKRRTRVQRYDSAAKRMKQVLVEVDSEFVVESPGWKVLDITGTTASVVASRWDQQTLSHIPDHRTVPLTDLRKPRESAQRMLT